jgi:D-serine ammonia-lyase
MSLAAYPLPSRETLLQTYYGYSLHDVPVPAAVIDIAKVKASCAAMLHAAKALDVRFRAHVKTHKTAEITKLQVGADCKDVRLVVSTIIEAEQLVPLLLDYRGQKAKINILYGVPLGPSHVSRLAAVARQLGEGSVTAMIDHPDQLRSLLAFKEQAGFPALVFLKTDSGSHRAGLAPDSDGMIDLVQKVSHAEEQGDLNLLGFYSHNSLSYGGNSPDDAMDMLKVEIDVCRQASQYFKRTRQAPLLVSVGASPSALSLQNLLPSAPAATTSANSLKDTLQLTKSSLELEIHAGVYPIFDIQQVSASSRHLNIDPHDVISVSVLAEVCSLYPNRTDQPEALISAGCLALAREPCKGYSGWGVLSTWNMPKDYSTNRDGRLVVNRISQEHGILAYDRKDPNRKHLPLQYGQKVRIWPNHACITLAMFDWYYVVDSETGSPDSIVDIYVRWRGW